MTNEIGCDPQSNELIARPNIDKFVSLSADGILNHYEPTFKNITKDLERLTTQQEVLMVDICTEKQHISQSVQETNLEEMVSVTEHYKDKLLNLKSCMGQLTDRSVRLRDRANRLQEVKQQQALNRESKRAAHQQRETQLIAKNDTDSS